MNIAIHLNLTGFLGAFHRENSTEGWYVFQGYLFCLFSKNLCQGGVKVITRVNNHTLSTKAPRSQNLLDILLIEQQTFHYVFTQ